VIEQLRGVRLADALLAVAIAAIVAGIAVTADGLVQAARATPGTDSMDWTDRLLLGLWSFRLEHTLWFTAGLVLLWHTVVRERDLRARAVDVARLAGGLATGYMLLAAAVVLGATVVAGIGAVGAGAAEVTFDGRERVLTWLLQATTGVAAGTIWALAAAALGEADAIAVRTEPQERPFGEEAESASGPPQPAAVAPKPAELTDEPLPPPPPVPLRREQPVADAPAEPARPAATTIYGRARRTFEERLAFSPRRDDARALLDQIARAERDGNTDEAKRLADRLGKM
jgi:hypothetical protein